MKKKLDDPVIMQGKTGGRWLLKPLSGGAVTVLEFSIEGYRLPDPVTLHPGDRVQLVFECEWEGPSLARKDSHA